MKQIDRLNIDAGTLLKILDDVEAYIFIKDHQGRYQYANRHTCDLFRRSVEDIIGRHDSALFNLEQSDDLIRNDALVLEKGRTIKQEEHNIIKATGEMRYYWTVKQPLRDEAGRIIGMYGIAIDTTEMVRLRHELEHQVQTDELTRLASRRYFLQMLEHSLAQSRRYQTPCSVVSFDLDLFKNINDSWGHQAGDEVLQQVAEVSRELVREPDIVGRIGGEEFCIMLPQTTLKGAVDLAERLRQAISALKIPGRGNGTITPKISAGVATMESSDGVDDLLRRADNKLYEAKNNGRNRVCS